MSRPPNVLWITSDQQHWRLLGCQNPEVRTPRLDRLAAQGTLFERAYCPNPTCTPTRASLITGLMPSHHGAYSLGTRLAESHTTVGECFHRAGYDAALIGKAHFQPLRGTDEFPSLEAYPVLQDLDFWRGFHGPFYGFNHIELARNHTDEAHVGQHYALWLEEQGQRDWRRWFQPPTGTTPAQRHRWNIPPEFHYNSWIAERTNARLTERAADGQPFFLWASFFDPHPSYLVPEPWASLHDPARVTLPRAHPEEHRRTPPPIARTQTPHPSYDEFREPDGHWLHGCTSHLHDEDALRRDIAIYYGMMSFLDHAVGRILDRLEELGQAENTLVVFTSDHGHFHGQHGLIAKGPFHYEDGVRVPLLVRWPGRVPAGRRSQALQSLVDLPVTSLQAAGLGVPRVMTGVDQGPVWTGAAESARDHVLVEMRHQPHRLYVRTVIDQRYKLSVWRGQHYGELYDLQDDPGEIHNLWDEPAAQPLKTRLLLSLVEAGMASEPVPMPRIYGA